MPSVLEDVYRAEKLYGFKFQVCDYGTKDTGHAKKFLDIPLCAHQVQALWNQKPRNVKVLTGPKSRCIAVDVDDPARVTYYYARIGWDTLCIRTSRGYRWFFVQPDDLVFNKIKLTDGVEIMADRHTGTFAGKHPGGKLYEVEYWPEVLPAIPDWLLTQIRQECDKRTITVTRPALPPLEGDIDLAAKALSYLDPDMPHDEWVAVGMALHNLDPVAGLSLWDNWSSGGKTYKPNQCAMRWRSFHQGGGIGRGRLFWMADVAHPGWRPAPVKVTRTPASNFRERPAPIEPPCVTKRLAAEINRFFQKQAESVLEVYRAVLRYFGRTAFTARRLMECSGLAKSMVNRGLMYARDFLFERLPENVDAVDFVAVSRLDSIDPIESLILEDPNSLQSATKSMPPGSRPASHWRLRAFEKIVQTLCYRVIFVSLERELDYRLATASRVRDLKGDLSYVGKINRTIQKLMDITEIVSEKAKLKKMAIKVRMLRHALFTDLTPVGEGNLQNGDRGEKSVRQLMVEEWHWERRDQENRTWDCERLLGMAKATVQRMGRAVGFYWKPQLSPQVFTRGCDLPAPHQYDTGRHAFPRSVIVGGDAKPYFSAHYVAQRMEALHVPATIMWQEGSIITYNPEEAALESYSKGQSNRRGKPVKPPKDDCANVGTEAPDWNYQGNPPKWSREGWAYYWLHRMGYSGNFDRLTDAQILEMLSMDYKPLTA